MTTRLDMPTPAGDPPDALSADDDASGDSQTCITIAGPTPTALKLPFALRALHHRNYRLFFCGQLISVIGTWMQVVGQSWLVYRLTDSAILLGLVRFASLIPVLLLSPVGGSFADRHNRHRIVIVTQTIAMALAFILAGLTFTGTVRVWHIFVLAASLGVVNSFDIPTRQAFVVDLVGRDDLINAIALNSSTINGARIVGPAVAGLLVATVGEGWCFFINAISYVAVIVGLLLMKITVQVHVTVPGSALEGVIEGFRYVKHTRPVRALLLLIAVVSLMGVPYMVLMPIFADEVLGAGARGLGLLMAAAGCGALVGGFLLASKRDVEGLRRWVPLAAGGFGVGLVLFSLSQSFWLSIAILVPTGFCMMLETASSNTLIQSIVPDQLRGRVMAVYSMMFLGMAPFGSLLAGALAHHFGAPATVSFGGAVCIIAAAVFAHRMAKSA